MKKTLISLALFLYCALPFAVFAESAALKKTLAELTGTKGPFTFAVLGDNRSGDRVYKKVIHQMMVRKPRFVLSTGDLIPTAGDREEWANFKNLSQPINVPYFLSPGNHDIDDKESLDVWRDELDLPGNETHYSFTVDKNLFVVLNSCEPGEDRRITGKQFEWLKGILDSKKYNFQFIFLHHPLFLPRGSTYDGKALDRYPELRDRLHNLFAERGVNAVFEGHQHTYFRIEKDGVNYIITGGGGAPLYGRDTFNHFILFKVDGPRADAKVIDRDGVMRDEFVIRR